MSHGFRPGPSIAPALSSAHWRTATIAAGVRRCTGNRAQTCPADTVGAEKVSRDAPPLVVIKQQPRQADKNALTSRNSSAPRAGPGAKNRAAARTSRRATLFRRRKGHQLARGHRWSRPVSKINQCVGCTRQFFTKSFLGDDVAALDPSSDEEPAPPRHRAGGTSMAWRTNAP